jgi:hypothetical protein
MSLLLFDLISNSFNKKNKSSISQPTYYLNNNENNSKKIIESYIKASKNNKNENNNLANLNTYRKKILFDNITKYKSINNYINDKNNNDNIKFLENKLNSKPLKNIKNDHISESIKKDINKVYNLISFKTINKDISRNKNENTFLSKKQNENNKYIYYTQRLEKKRIDLKNAILKVDDLNRKKKETYYKGNKIYEKLQQRFGYEYDEHIKKNLFFKEFKQNKEYLNKKFNIPNTNIDVYIIKDKFDSAINDYINIIKSSYSRKQSKEKIKNINLNLENSVKEEKKRTFSSRNQRNIFNKSNIFEKDSYLLNNYQTFNNNNILNNKLKKEEEIKQFQREFDEKII